MFMLSISQDTEFFLFFQDVDDNLTFLDYDPETGNLYAIHEVNSFEDVPDSGVVSRWTVGADGETFERQEVGREGNFPI